MPTKISSKILKFPETRQAFDFDCGATAVQSVLYYYGIERRSDELIEILQSDRNEGTTPGNIVKAFIDAGFNVHAGQMTVADLRAWIDRDIPVIVTLQAWSEKEKDYAKTLDEGHYVVAIGYDDDTVYFDDPSLLDNRGCIPIAELDERWHDIDRNKWLLEHFGIAVFGRKPEYNPNKIIKIESLQQRVARRWAAR